MSDRSLSEHHPLALRRLGAEQAELHNLLLSRQPRLEIAAAQETLRLRLVPEPGPVADGQQFLLAAGAARMRLTLDAPTLAAAAGIWTDAPAVEDLPPPLREALITARLSPVLDALADTFAIDARLVDGKAATQATKIDGWAEIGLVPFDAPGAPPIGRLECDQTLTRALCSAIGKRRPIPSMTDWNELPVDVTLGLGGVRLDARELDALAKDDILPLPSDAPIAAKELVLRHRDTMLACARLDHNTLTIQRLAETCMTDDDNGDALEQGPSASDDATAATTANGGGPDLGRLEVRLDFELGHLSLTLGELQNLRPGTVLELNTPASRPVQIRAGRQLVGHGELIQIEDRLGVIVRHLRARNEPGTA